MNNSLNSLINESKSLLILLPLNADMDSVAAGLSLGLSLNRTDVTIACPSPMLVEFNRLVGIDKVTAELGSKNLSISFADYPADNVEKVSYDIVEGEFKLTIIPKSSVTPPQKDQVILTYSGISADTIIAVGGENESHFPNLKSKDLEGAKIAHIGVKSSSIGKSVISLDAPASSISELVAQFLKEQNVGISADVATNLLMGIEDATQGLSSGSVTADTFALIADLMKAGGKRYIAAENPQPHQFPQGSIPGVPMGNQMNRPANFPKSWLEPKIFKGTNVS